MYSSQSTKSTIVKMLYESRNENEGEGKREEKLVRIDEVNRVY